MMYGYGMGAGAWVMMVVFWVAIIALVGFAIVRIFPGRGQDEIVAAPRTPAETPQQILDRRLASGEIDVDTYERLGARLRGGSAPN